MSDLVFVILTGAFFALASLILKGVERLCHRGQPADSQGHRR